MESQQLDPIFREPLSLTAAVPVQLHIGYTSISKSSTPHTVFIPSNAVPQKCEGVSKPRREAPVPPHVVEEPVIRSLILVVLIVRNAPRIMSDRLRHIQFFLTPKLDVRDFAAGNHIPPGGVIVFDELVQGRRHISHLIVPPVQLSRSGTH
jgi:hypothetical protein